MPQQAADLSTTGSCRRSPTAGIGFSDWDDLDEDDRKYLDEVFEERIFPVLTPLAVDPGHPFPYISNLSLNLAVVVARPRHRRAPLRPGEGAAAAAPLRGHCPTASASCPSSRSSPPTSTACSRAWTSRTTCAFRVTRNADLTLEEEEADDLLAAVEMELRRRRFGRAVRLEVDHGMTAEMLELLLRELDLERRRRVVPPRRRSTSAGCGRCTPSTAPDLKDEPWPPVTPARLADAAEDEPRHLLGASASGDVLVHHPYDSFATSVEEFIRQASTTRKVLAIKLTLYRTVGRQPDRRSR